MSGEKPAWSLQSSGAKGKDVELCHFPHGEVLIQVNAESTAVKTALWYQEQLDQDEDGMWGLRREREAGKG